MADVQVNVVGLDALVRSLRKCGDDLADLKDAHARAGEIIAREAAARAPRGPTGRLKASVRPARQARRARVQAGSRAVPYAAPIHWGWPSRGIEARPFISEAAQATESVWLPQYMADVKEALAKVKGA